ncbi:MULTISPECIES: hypothetical protein [Microcoleaceae]|uniref:hypothetical protein n=1 Tax=Microcoleaceae TaxID=1892252 RepID=UPI001882F9C7|nr:hypothetical protein [Tychonema sp. LEGE 06208]MBE9161750.1 hypothetical protein [Tychonema sp. LEGE 06208]
MLSYSVSLQTAVISLAVMLSIAVTSSFGRSEAEGVQLDFWAERSGGDAGYFLYKQSNL